MQPCFNSKGTLEMVKNQLISLVIGYSMIPIPVRQKPNFIIFYHTLRWSIQSLLIKANCKYSKLS